MNLNLHSLLRYYVPGAVFIFLSLIVNCYFDDYLNYITIITEDSGKFIIGTTALPLVIGFLLSWIWRGLHMNIMYHFTGKNDYINSRVIELKKIFNVNNNKNQKLFNKEERSNAITLRSFYDFILYGVNIDKDIDKFKLHRERITFQLSNLHCVNATLLGVIIIFLSLLCYFFDYGSIYPIILLIGAFFLLVWSLFRFWSFFITTIIFTTVFSIIWFAYKPDSFSLIQYLLFLFIPLLMILISLYRKVINDALVQYERILIKSYYFREIFQYCKYNRI